MCACAIEGPSYDIFLSLSIVEKMGQNQYGKIFNSSVIILGFDDLGLWNLREWWVTASLSSSESQLCSPVNEFGGHYCLANIHDKTYLIIF